MFRKSLVVCALVLALTPSVAEGGEWVQVPGLTGRSCASSAVTLRALGLRVVNNPSVYSSRPRRTVARYGVQSRAWKRVGGRLYLRRGARIWLTPSKGAAPRYAWRTAVASVYAWEPQCVAGPYPNTAYMDAHGIPYFAHKTLPFGTRVIFRHNGRTIVGVCCDRGPYVGNRAFDMGGAITRTLGLDGVDTVEWAYVP